MATFFSFSNCNLMNGRRMMTKNIFLQPGTNDIKINEDLEQNWAVVAEAIQTILRREKYPNPYEALKALTRGNHAIDKKSIHAFINGLKIPASVKQELKKITPQNYTGV